MEITKSMFKRLKNSGSFENALALLEAETGRKFDTDELEVLREEYEKLMSASDEQLAKTPCEAWEDFVDKCTRKHSFPPR